MNLDKVISVYYYYTYPKHKFQFLETNQNYNVKDVVKIIKISEKIRWFLPSDETICDVLGEDEMSNILEKVFNFKPLPREKHLENRHEYQSFDIYSIGESRHFEHNGEIFKIEITKEDLSFYNKEKIIIELLINLNRISKIENPIYLDIIEAINEGNTSLQWKGLFSNELNIKNLLNLEASIKYKAPL